MAITQVTDNLIQVTRLRFVNAFLVREQEGFTLIDTTVGGGAKELIEVAMPELDARIHAGEAIADKQPPGSWPKIATAPERALDPSLLAVGHGRPTPAPGPAMDGAIARARGPAAAPQPAG